MQIRIQNSVRRLVVAAFALVLLLGSRELASAQTDPLDNWQQRANPSFQIPKGIAYGNGTFVAVGDNGLLMTSPNGVIWTQLISPPVIYSTGVVFGGGAFYAFGYYSPSSLTNCIIRSLDGVTWTKAYEFVGAGTGVIKAGAYGNSRLVFVGSDRIIIGIISPPSWTEVKLPDTSGPGAVPLSSVTYGLGRFVAIGRYATSHIVSSSDGLVWRYDFGPALDPAASSIAYGNGVFVATWRTNSAPDSGFLISTNLTFWNYVPAVGIGAQNVGAVIYGGGQFIASLGASGSVYTSPTGLVWTNRSSNAGGASAFGYGAGTFVTSGLRQSDVFATTASPPPSNLAINLFAGVLVTGTEGQTYRIESSTNLNPGSTWLPLTNLTLPFSPYRWIDTTTPAQSWKFYRAVQTE